MIGGEEEPVVTEASSKHALPYLALEGLYVTGKGVVFHVGEYPRQALLNGLGKTLEVVLGIPGKLIGPTHVSTGSRILFFPRESV